MKNIYTDGIFDLFHRGHVEYLNLIKFILLNVMMFEITKCETL